MDPDERDMRLYTLEYQKAAERYDNIYRSIWTIFSYLTAVAAGVLAFGSDRIEPHALICIAAIPLLFWFWTTYLPLDRYGNQVVNRLRELECLLKNRFGTELKHFHGPAHGLSLCRGILRAVIKPDVNSPTREESGNSPRRFARLRSWWARQRGCHRVLATLRGFWNEVHRARFAIIVIFIVLHTVVIYNSNVAWNLHKAGQPLFLAKPPAAPQVGR